MRRLVWLLAVQSVGPGFLGDHRAAFPILLAGNQIADYVFAGYSLLDAVQVRRSCGYVANPDRPGYPACPAYNPGLAGSAEQHPVTKCVHPVGGSCAYTDSSSGLLNLPSWSLAAMTARIRPVSVPGMKRAPRRVPGSRRPAAVVVVRQRAEDSYEAPGGVAARAYPERGLCAAPPRHPVSMTTRISSARGVDLR